MATIDYFGSMMEHPSGNYVCQKLFKIVNENQIDQILIKIKISLSRIAFN